jgi:RNA recognition motif-containing protein
LLWSVVPEHSVAWLVWACAGGLDEQVTEQLLRAAFVPFGDIVSVQLPSDTASSTCVLGRQTVGAPSRALATAAPHRGFGFVEFALAEDAQAAIDNMHQSELNGRVIKVNLASQSRKNVTSSNRAGAQHTLFPSPQRECVCVIRTERERERPRDRHAHGYHGLTG